MSQRYRNQNIFIRVTETEKEIIEKKSKAAGFSSINSYALQMLTNGIIISVDLQELLELNTSINKIGVNINQIAYKANSSDIVSPEDLQDVMEYLRNIQEVQAIMLKKLSFKV